MFPFRLSMSGFYQFLAGSPFTRTVNAVSALGRNLGQGNVVIHSGTRNEESYDNGASASTCASTTTCRSAGRTSPWRSTSSTRLNANTVTRVNALSGASFNRVIEFVPPRVVRFGVKVRL